MTEIAAAAHTVLLPVTGNMTIDPWLRQLLECGTRSVLMGESRAEYVAREMTAERRRTESADAIHSFTRSAEGVARHPLIVAIDQEPWGIARLHDLVPRFPGPGAVATMTDEHVVEVSAALATAARRLGVTMFLSPVVDVLTGENPWLKGRTLAVDHEEAGRIASAFVRGVQSAGVSAVAKHFPGHPQLAEDPAEHATARLTAPHSVSDGLIPFRRVIAAGVAAIMTGPVVVEAVDASEPASTSLKTITFLRRSLGFDGLIVSDDLDTPSTLHGRSLIDTIMDSMEAGADLLLLPGGPELLEVVDRLVDRAVGDRGFATRLMEASGRVRKVADAAGLAAPAR